jgi:hypothetical protein
MTSAEWRMILKPRQQAHPNPQLLYGEPDGPKALANPAEHIPCLSALTIRPSSPWPQFEAQQSKASTPTTHDESGFHALEESGAPIPLFKDADPVPLSIDDVGEEDENEEYLEEEQSLATRPPFPFDELDFDLVDSVIVAEIAGLDGFRSSYDQVRR